MATTPTYLLKDGTIVTFKTTPLKRITTGTKDDTILYTNESSALTPFSSLAAKAAQSLDTDIEEEILPPPPPPHSNFIPYKFKGKVVNSQNQDKLSGVKVKDSYDVETTTNPRGSFTIKGEYTKEKDLNLIISLKDYEIKTIPIKTQSGGIRDDINVIKLQTTKVSVEEDILEEQAIDSSGLQKIKDFNPKDFISTLVTKLSNTIKTKLIPAILTLIAAFGVSKLAELKKKGLTQFKDMNPTCPASIDELNKLIDKKNKLTKQLNNIFKGVESITKFLKIPPKIIDASKITTKSSKAFVAGVSFIPSTFASPIPVGPILIAKDLINLLEDLIDVLKGKIGAGTFQLDFLLDSVKNVLALLNILDSLIQGCAEEMSGDLITCTLPDGTTQQMTPEQCTALGGSYDDNEIPGIATQAQISQELLDSTTQQSNQLSPVVTNVNGFEMGVETEVTDKPLKRRRATAKNTEGVIVLLGEYSYSSNDQILIDELVFYIQQNNLKAE